MDFDDLGFERGYQIMRAYGRSKLANVLHTRHLARRLEGTGVTANCLHPGAVSTNIWSGAPWFARPVLAVAKRLVMVKPATGGERIAYLATSPDVEGRSGGYYEQDRLKDPSGIAQDDAVGDRLDRVSRELVGLGASAG
jgi:NAD(P)-dependent dehydrogenase (short-subunit alcohol dehydrogenase family)